MQELVKRIREEGEYLGDGILKVDGFLNHQIDPRLITNIGREFERRFQELGVDNVSKVITAEVSGIGPGLAAATQFGVPLIYARKSQPLTMPETVYRSTAPSHTKGDETELVISPEYLSSEDRVIIVDDFLATGRTLEAIMGLIEQCRAQCLGIGCVIEKSFEGGRERLSPYDVPIVTLAVVDSLDRDSIVVHSGTSRVG